VAQAKPAAPSPQPRGARLAADERTLWLLRIEPSRSQVCSRGASTPFTPIPPLNAAITSVAATRGTLYAFVDDGDLYSFGQNGWTSELNLPGRVQPIDLVGADTELYALLASPAAGELPRLDNGVSPSASQPFDPGDAPLTIAHYDPRGWAGLALAPRAVTAVPGARLHPRLAVFQGALHLLWPASGTLQIRCVRLDPETGAWSDGPSTSDLPDLTAFWIVMVSRVPTLVAAVRAAAGGEELRALRPLGDAQGSGAEWRPAALQLSGLPADVRPAEYSSAQAFNQHVVLLMKAVEGATYLRFGRVETPPTENTASLVSVFDQRRSPGTAPRWLQTATLLILMGLLLALFAFRRGALARVIELPPDCALAFAFQRLAGCVLDLAPFTVAAAALLGVPWQAALRELFMWAAGTDAMANRLPALNTLLWWVYSTSAYALYALIMECLTRRTIGKVLVGTHVLSESGSVPNLRQVLVRNGLRLLELQPPLWILGFLVVLSRNRQRVGDLFARTVVIRHAKTTERGGPEA